jgi:hypothetical protein
MQHREQCRAQHPAQWSRTTSDVKVESYNKDVTYQVLQSDLGSGHDVILKQLSPSSPKQAATQDC